MGNINYQIKITRVEPNENFDEEMATFRSEQVWRHRNEGCEIPQREVLKNILLCELTPEQYEAVKEAVLATFK